MEGYAAIRFHGQWIKRDENTLKYVGGAEKLIQIPPKTTLEGLIHLLKEECGIDPIRNNIQLSMKPRKLELDSPIQIEDDGDVQGLIYMSQYLKECIPVYVKSTSTECEVKEEANEEIKVKNEAIWEHLIDFQNDAFYIANEWVHGDKQKVPDWGDFEGNDMSDILLDETVLGDMSLINCDINSFQLEDQVLGDGNYSDPVCDNVPTDPFKWLPNFLSQPSASLSGIESRRESYIVKIGDIFNDKHHLKDAVKQFAMNTGFQFRVLKSDPNRWKIRCCDANCNWELTSGRLKPSKVFRLNKMTPIHTCSIDQVKSHHRQVRNRVLGQFLRSKFVLIDRIYRPKEIIIDITDRYKIDISYLQVWWARNWTSNSLRGSHEESFMLLPEYCYNLEHTNPGTVTAIETDDQHHFKYFFMALGCSIRVFKQFLRPVICIDAAFLKGRYLGHLFFAVALDGNNQIYPIAFGVGKEEDHETWCWFLTKLKDCINEIPELTIISDRHHAIYSAMTEVFPDVHHGYCCHHLLCNIRAKYKCNSKVAYLYWKAAKSYTEVDFATMMRSIDELHLPAGAYLREVGFHRWSRAYFPSHRYNIMTTNIAKSFNALVKHARGLPITMLVEFIRGTLQRWFYERRNHANDYSHHVTLWIETKLGSHVQKGALLEVRPITNVRYQVLNYDGYITMVDFNERTCTCKKFQLSRIPCKHAVAVARIMRLTNVNAWIHPFFTTDYYRAIYAEPVNPLGNQSEWLPVEEKRVILPPELNHRRSGRPSNTK